MRGEHLKTTRGLRFSGGSSPRARGALAGGARQDGQQGIIPACAGSTGAATPARSPRRDHPRVRGEHRRDFAHKLSTTGSSPRARGARPGAHGRGRGRGIIPACAGSTPPARRQARPRGDHPRVRGEHRRVRGRGVAAGDHPRVRGEHIEVLSEARGERGSSPRARGAPADDLVGPSDRGIIPACAGSTPGGRSSLVTSWDHPRVRGEHCARAPSWGSNLGSSPRARGARPTPRRRAPTAGIIPACAGSTAGRS